MRVEDEESDNDERRTRISFHATEQVVEHRYTEYVHIDHRLALTSE